MIDPKDKKLKTDGKRLPYEPPRVIAEVGFETLALSCSGDNPGICPGPLHKS